MKKMCPPDGGAGRMAQASQMDHLVQERCIHALTIALGPRYRLRSSIALAEDLEDLILVEAARSAGLSRDVLSRLPQQIISKRADVGRAYHTILEALLHQLGRAELNTGEWWDRVNARARASAASAAALGAAEEAAVLSGGSAAQAPMALSAEAFFEHYRPRPPEETWEGLAQLSGGMAKYRSLGSSSSSSSSRGGEDLCFAFPAPEAPASVDDYLRVYCGSGPAADAVAQRVLLAVHSEGGGGLDAEPLLPSLPALRAATQEAEAVRALGKFVPPPGALALKRGAAASASASALPRSPAPSKPKAKGFQAKPKGASSQASGLAALGGLGWGASSSASAALAPLAGVGLLPLLPAAPGPAAGAGAALGGVPLAALAALAGSGGAPTLPPPPPPPF